MSTPINLNKFRKDRAKVKKRAEADANALRHGRSKADKQAERRLAEKAANDLDGHKRER